MPERHQITFSKGDEETRLDKFLSMKLIGYSRSQRQKLIREGNVLLNGGSAEKAGQKLTVGDKIEVFLPDQKADGLVPENIELDILYEDDDVLIVNKPSGMVVHPGAGNMQGTLVNALLAYYPAIRHVGALDRPGVVHRLDKDTSGALIIAKTEKAYKWLVKQFKGRDIEKRYLALVDGCPPTPTGRIEAPIIRDPVARTSMKVGLRGQGKFAVSEYFVIKKFQRHTYLEIHPITGRTHQIRVHLSYLEIPVVGDTVYGRRQPSIEMDRFFLHARSLSVRLPGERLIRTFEAPLPQNLLMILENLEKTESLDT